MVTAPRGASKRFKGFSEKHFFHATINRLRTFVLGGSIRSVGSVSPWWDQAENQRNRTKIAPLRTKNLSQRPGKFAQIRLAKISAISVKV